ncbi:MAG TPA: NIPSNAP family protein [Gammaproteobacteria bacterium]|jgi:heme-degrading monooxygenase HmoA|nr:MAG: NIPSNAP family protein [Gammaproteobacteria bacterium TMED134]RZO72726.1 MAG: NIPSNAP family protein [OM182 bacterium]HAL42322.1 NIPSNAP family protein [Gammaproteobacteria bacterium]HBK17391.1 NIPSNAP family protein [Gammaproteobacteria bacterium]|tara:strand:+ start:3652 stop:4065 length:414 start_codon:yes stop_codon:yes gene_type:complete
MRVLLTILGLLCGACSISALADNHTPAVAGPVYELRVYTAHPGKIEALEQRFVEHTMALFEKHGIRNVAYFKPVDREDKLLYIVAHPSQVEAAAAWGAFSQDPEWKRVKEASEADGALVKAIERTVMLGTPYSPTLP